MRVVGIDPGVTGAIALMIDAQLHDVWDMPVMDTRASGALVADLLRDWKPDVVIIERTQPMPKNGSISSFKLGYNTGVVEGAVTALSYPLVRISPAVWKKAAGLTGKDKDASRLLAIEAWPFKRHLLARKKDGGRAEAALIGFHHFRKEAA